MVINRQSNTIRTASSILYMRVGIRHSFLTFCFAEGSISSEAVFKLRRAFYAHYMGSLILRNGTAHGRGEIFCTKVAQINIYCNGVAHFLRPLTSRTKNKSSKIFSDNWAQKIAKQYINCFDMDHIQYTACVIRYCRDVW